MIACVGSVVTGGTGAVHRRHSRQSVETRYSGDFDREIVEEVLSACDSAARGSTWPRGVGPVGVRVEHVRVELGTGRIGTKHVIDAQVKRRASQVDRTTKCTVAGQRAYFHVEGLGGVQNCLE